MPKEQINYPDAIQGPDGFLPPGMETTIHWSGGPAGYVQLGVEFDVATMTSYLAQLRKDSPTDSRARFYTNELSRPDLQRLIRAAKRARDAVFGADE